MISSQKEFVDNVIIQERLGSSDQNQLHCNINIKSEKIKVKQRRRDFRKGNYKEIRKSLALIDGNDKMKNKTATEYWNIEHKFAQNIKSDSKSSYVRSKQNVRDRVGPLEDNAGNIITRSFSGRGIKYALQFSVHAGRY